MGSKKHKKNKSERRDRADGDYSGDFIQNPSLKLILKVGSNSTPEYSTDSPAGQDFVESSGENTGADYYSIATGGGEGDDGGDSSRVKKSKKKKKKKDREKKHKHHKEKRHRHRHHRHEDDEDHQQRDDQSSSQEFPVLSPEAVESSNLMINYPGDLRTVDFLTAKPVTRPMVPLRPLLSPTNAPSGNESDSQLLSPTSSTGGGGSRVEKAGSESGREPRTCVLKMKAQQTPLSKILEHLLRSLEKRDPQQYFAWPVTDDIAPGYSTIIARAMDFSTMRQKNEENGYSTVPAFADDFRLMCDNAMRYNHGETVYHKAAKKLLQAGNKMLQPEALVRSLRGSLAVHLRSLGEKELGFDWMAVMDAAGGEQHQQHHQQHGLGQTLPQQQQQKREEEETAHLDSADEGANEVERGMIVDGVPQVNDGSVTQGDDNGPNEGVVGQRKPSTTTATDSDAETMSRKEPPTERSEEEEILRQVKRAAERVARERQLRRKRIAKIGFLRQNKDGTTSMQILVDVDGVCGAEKLIALGDFTGKLKSGTGSLNSAREDARNVARLVKPIEYGAFASFAPVFDSRFANLTQEETQLVQQTYGGESLGTDYAESALNFTKHSEYASQMANGILDALTHGEHSRVMRQLMAEHQPRYEEREVDRVVPIAGNTGVEEVKVDLDSLRSLSEFGIDTTFLDEWTQAEKCAELQLQLTEKLSANATILDQLNSVQCERLSQPLPHHLQLVQKARPNEVELAHQVTNNLVDMAKTLTPEAIATTPGLRKAMGVSCGNLEGFTPKMSVYNLNGLKFGGVSAASSDYDTSEPMDIETEALVQHPQEDRGMDLDHELKQFLEAGR